MSSQSACSAGLEMSCNITTPFCGEEISLWKSVLLVCLYVISTISGLFGSGLIIFTLVSDHQFRQASYTVYLTNLVITDLFVQLYYFPLLAVGLLTGRHPVVDNAHCVVNGFLFFVCSIVFMFTLAAISLDRYACVCHRLVYMRYVSRKNSCIVIVVMWLAACLVCIPSALDGTLGFDSKIRMCFLQHQGTFTLGHAVTVAVVTVTTVAVGVPNALIYRTYHAHQRRVGQSLAINSETQRSSSEIPFPMVYSISAQLNDSNAQTSARNSPPQMPQRVTGVKTLNVAVPASPNLNHEQNQVATECSGLNFIRPMSQELSQPLEQDSKYVVLRSANETDDDVDSDQRLTLPDDYAHTLTVVEGHTQPAKITEHPNRAMTVSEYFSQRITGGRGDPVKAKRMAQGSYQDVPKRSRQKVNHNSSQAQNVEDSLKDVPRHSSYKATELCNKAADQTATANKSKSQDNNRLSFKGCDQQTAVPGISATSSQTASFSQGKGKDVTSNQSWHRKWSVGFVSKSDITLVRSLLLIFLGFFVLTVPATVAFVVRNAVYISPFVYCLLIWLYAVNTSVNWIIYGIMNSRFRLGYKRAMKKLKACRKGK